MELGAYTQMGRLDEFYENLKKRFDFDVRLNFRNVYPRGRRSFETMGRFVLEWDVYPGRGYKREGEDSVEDAGVCGCRR